MADGEEKYAAAADVHGLLPHLGDGDPPVFSATSQPSLTEVDEECVDFSREVEGYMGPILQEMNEGIPIVKVTYPHLYNFMRKVVKTGVAGNIQRGTSDDDPDYRAQYERMIEDIVNRDIDIHTLMGKTQQKSPKGVFHDDDVYATQAREGLPLFKRATRW